MINPTWRECSPPEVAAWIVLTTASIAGEDGVIHCVLPGGATPRPVLSFLCGILPDAIGITFSLTDERCVPPDDPKRNEKMVADSMGTHRLISLLDGVGLMPCERVPEPEISLVGMGLDGHVASLFPGSSALEDAERAPGYALVSVSDAPDGTIRVSRSYAGLAGRVASAVLVSGSGKRKLLRRVCRGELPSLPISRLLQRNPEMQIFDLQDGYG